MRTPLIYSASLCLCLATACSKEPAPAESAAAPAPAPVAADAPPPVAREMVFTAPELEQMVAPIALYPDPLLAQVLMASTYPGDVADAVTWSAANPDATGDAAVRSVQDQPWDPSVQSLVAFPQALVALGQDPGWVQRLGDAFLAQPDDVMEAIQRLRAKAAASGNLASNEYMVVRNEPAAPAAPAPAPTDPGYVETAYPEDDGGDTIIIEPASETVYVPSYDPGVVYGAWSYPAYPPYYYPPSPYYYPAGGALWAGLAFGAGIAIADGLWGDCDWNGGDIDIDVDRYNNINVNNRIDRGNGGDRWQHNARNRDGVPYRDRGNRERNGQRLDGARDRDGLRGDDPGRAEARNRERDRSRDAARDRSRDSLARHGVDSPARTPDEARQRARDAGAERDRANRDQAARDQARRDQAGRDQARRDQAGRDQARRDQGNRDRSRDQANRDRGGQRSGGNAFNGSRNPGASRAQADRGRSSHGGSQRGGGSHSAGRQANRSPPSRSGGGGRRR